MYHALYRKYRPADFGDVYGQPHIVRTLKNQLKEGKLSHAYLFTGSRGTGKTTCARILARAVNCLDPQNGEPCNKCENCLADAQDKLVDITEIDAASNNGVDDIRELRDNSAYTPVSAKYRVFIIDEVHMLSSSAFNALLKTLEEPPQHVIFILATTEVHKLPATILSRCQRFDFRRIQPEDIAERLTHVAKLENIQLQQDGADMIAALADGAMRDALSLLDICSADGDVINQEKVLDVAGLSGREYLHNIAKAISDKDTSYAIDLIDDLYKRAKDLSRLCNEMISYFRDMMLIKSIEGAEKYILASKAEIESLKETVNILPMEKIIHTIDVFEDTLTHINSGADRRTMVERALIMLCEPKLDTSPSSLLSRIEALENNRVIAPPPAPVTEVAPIKAEPEKTVEKPQPKKEEKPPITEPTDKQNGKFERWSEVLAELGRGNSMLKAVLKGSGAYIKDSYMLIDVENEMFKDMVNSESRHRDALKQAIFKVTGKHYNIGPYTRSEKVEQAPADDPLDSLIKNAHDNGLM